MRRTGRRPRLGRMALERNVARGSGADCECTGPLWFVCGGTEYIPSFKRSQMGELQSLLRSLHMSGKLFALANWDYSNALTIRVN